MSIKKNISAPLSSGLGATRRAAMLLLVLLFTTMTAWANDPWWLRDGDSWNETTKTLTVNTPEVVTDAYKERSEIEYVIFSNSVTSIGFESFKGCSNLKTVFVGSSVASIDVGAFGSCPNLKSIIITRTASAQSIYHDSPFPDNTKIYVPADENGNVLQKYRQAEGWWQLNSNKRLFPSWSSGTHAAALNEGVLTVVGIGNLTSYVGPDFKDVVLSAVIGEGVTSIGEHAFLGCVNMTSVSIPASVTSIDNAAFLANQELGAITVAAGNQTFDSRNNCNAIIRKADNTLMIGCKGTVIPDGVTSIADRAFYICSGLTDISIPNSVTSIGATAFWGCTSLQSVAIGSGLASIDPSAFNSCHNLTTITVDENNQTFDSHGNCNAIIRKSDNTLVAGCKGTIIPNSVTSIGEKAFGYNDGLISIAIPNTVTSIGDQAFMNCHALESVAIYATSVPAQGTQAFCGNKDGRKFYVLSDVVNAYKTAWNEFANDIKAIEANGICSKDNSENLKWVLTGEASNRILAIFGTGDMKDYENATDRP